jgi:hypothetical protein
MAFKRPCSPFRAFKGLGGPAISGFPIGFSRKALREKCPSKHSSNVFKKVFKTTFQGLLKAF